jgi:deoxyribodipyrimidine photolyase-like uncharacterized protein
MADNAHFLTARDDVARFFSGIKRFLMESFYRHMRKRYDILLEGGKPEGGKWNFDRSNRNRYDGAIALPEVPVFNNDVSDIVNMIHRFAKNPRMAMMVRTWDRMSSDKKQGFLARTCSWGCNGQCIVTHCPVCVYRVP